MKTHKDLDIWKKGVDLVTGIYRLTKSFPEAETYGLSAQMRRAAVSYPSNIAKGAARNSKADYIRLLINSSTLFLKGRVGAHIEAGACFHPLHADLYQR